MPIDNLQRPVCYYFAKISRDICLHRLSRPSFSLSAAKGRKKFREPSDCNNIYPLSFQSGVITTLGRKSCKQQAKGKKNEHKYIIMKKNILIAALALVNLTSWANTYIHYSVDENTDVCHIYDEKGKWIGAFKTEWKNDTDIVGDVTLYNWSEKWGNALKTNSTDNDKHIYLKTPPKKTATLEMALSTSK